jgi:hypothetical protein
MAKWLKVIASSNYPGIFDLDKADAFFLSGDEKNGKCVDVWLNNNVVRVYEHNNPQAYNTILAFMKGRGF